MGQSSEHSPLAKVHYRPIEAAIRWTHLWRRERQILDVLQARSLPEPGDFPQWPALRLNAERIFDAILNRELPFAVDGAPAPVDTPLDHPNLTVRHVDLKFWMQRYYPEQRPRFLFSALERSVHPVITINDVRALTFERDSLRSLVTERDEEIRALRTEVRALLKSIEVKVRPPSASGALSSRAERTLLHIVGGQNSLLLGKDPSGKAYSRFRTQEEIIAALTDRYGERLGITKSTLENKFAAANRILATGRP